MTPLPPGAYLAVVSSVQPVGFIAHGGSTAFYSKVVPNENLSLLANGGMQQLNIVPSDSKYAASWTAPSGLVMGPYAAAGQTGTVSKQAIRLVHDITVNLGLLVHAKLTMPYTMELFNEKSEMAESVQLIISTAPNAPQVPKERIQERIDAFGYSMGNQFKLRVVRLPAAVNTAAGPPVADDGAAVQF